MMQTYKEFNPTEFDSHSNFMAHSDIAYLADWYVVLGQNRDSDCLTESNFATALKELGGESETIEVHRFGHWACGWYELLLAAPIHKEKVADIERRMDSYPVLDEDDFSEREENLRNEYWSNCSMREKIDLIKDSSEFRNGKVSIFAARRKDYSPIYIDGLR